MQNLSVTSLEETRAELSRSKVAAEAANQAKSEFLANMSHEIRTPMTAILGFADVLRRGFATTEALRRRYLNTIHSSGQHLLGLINDILDLSRVEAGRLQVEQARCSPHQIVCEVLAVLDVKAREKGVELVYEPAGQVPATIQTDPGKLRQALMNLVGNAVKFTEQGSVRVIARRATSAGAPQLIFDVIDTGIGMAPDSLQRIFKPFTQADGSVSRRYGGTGLGLVISRRLAEALGGQLTVESELGRGSRFTLAVAAGPLDDVAMLDEAAARAAGRVDTETTPGLPALPACRVLVVDDGAENQELITLILQQAGACVDAAEHGLAAVERAAATSYDAILMDMQMPVMDGFEATRTLRSRGYGGPIVALTASAMREDEHKCRAAGCSAFLAKPINVELLLGTLVDALGSGSSRPTMPASAARPAEESRDDADRSPLVSTLPTHDPRFAALVRRFVPRLAEQLDAMEDAADEGDLERLAQLAHWLKGSGGNVGFAAFHEPARQLEQLAREGQREGTAALVAHLRGLEARIVVPTLEAPDQLQTAGS